MPRFDYKQALEELKTYRLTNERRSETVAALGACLIRGNYTSKLGDEGRQQMEQRHIHTYNCLFSILFYFFLYHVVWPLYEQICIAALDVDDQELANVTEIDGKKGGHVMILKTLLALHCFD